MNRQIDWPQIINNQPGIDVAAALDSLPFYVLMIDAKHRILFANKIMCQSLNMDMKDVIGAYCPTLVHGVKNFPGCPLKEALATNLPVEKEVFDARHNRWMKPSIYPTGQFTTDGEPIFLHLAYDITESKAADKEILRLNRLYSVISQVNQTVIRAKSPEQLLGDVCSALVEKGEFKLAWVGKLEPESQKVISVASFGPKNYVKDIVVYANDRPEGKGPAGRSIRENKPIVQNDFLNESVQLPWHDRASKFGFRSSAAFPIALEGKVWGTLAVYSDIVDYFGIKEIALLQETAGDVSFALDNLDRDQKQHAADQALKASQEKYHNLFTSMAEGFGLHEIILDESGKPIDYRFLEVNTAFENLTGLVRDRIIGRTVRQAIPGIEEFWIETYGRVALTGESVRFDSFAAPLGKWYECYAYPAGANLFAVMFTDISERKKALEILGRYELIANDSRDIILFLNLPDGKLLEANAAAIKTYGFSRKELLSKTIYDLRAPATRDLVEHQIAKANSEGVLFETQHMRKDGSTFPVEVSSRGADIEGHRALVSVIRDISERKQAEIENQELRSKAEMSSRLAAVGEMAAGIAHEINNPLTGVIGFSEMLLDKPDLPNDIRQDVKIINDGSQRVKNIVKRMLTFARQTKPVRTPTSITELIDNTLELRGYVLRTANIEVIKDYEPNLPWLTVDPGQMQEVFLNLIVNAEYAMKKANGKGKLTVRAVKLDKTVCISITDDGPGISKPNMRKLFQPFFTTKEPGEGTGLGLSLSHGIVLEHGGTIQAISGEGQGTTFIIELPVKDLPTEEPPVPAQDVKNTPSFKKARVLVVDDEPDVRSYINKVLTTNGHFVEEAANPAGALEKMGQNKFNVVLLDVRMPGMSGTELYGVILKRWPEMDHRVIFISGDTSDFELRQYMTINKLPYISKPFDQATLKIRVNAILSLKQADNDKRQ